MSSLTLLMTLLLVTLHACNARQTFGFRFYDKAIVEKMKLENEMDVKALAVFDSKESFTRSKIISVASLANRRNALKIQDTVRKARSLLESESHENEATRTDKDETPEDMVVMDYITPRRKSPIHNHN